MRGEAFVGAHRRVTRDLSHQRVGRALPGVEAPARDHQIVRRSRGEHDAREEAEREDRDGAPPLVDPRVAIDGGEHQEREDEGLVLGAEVGEDGVDAEEVHRERRQGRHQNAGRQQREESERQQHDQQIDDLAAGQCDGNPAPGARHDVQEDLADR